jgi:hypothetical protein
LSSICIKRIIYTFFRTKIKKVGGGGEGANKKDNPKEIFYEFLKLFRKQKKKRLFPPSSAELFENPEEIRKKRFFWKNGFLKRVLHTHISNFVKKSLKSDFNQKIVTIFIFFVPISDNLGQILFYQIKVMFYVKKNENFHSWFKQKE